jgi:hypothetical protein
VPLIDTESIKSDIERRKTMPYLLGWLLGVPVIVLVILYLVFH